MAEDRLGGSVETARWSSGVLDITATGVTKLAALRDYCSRRSIPQTSVVAIGDTMVDLPMMRWAEMGIAVSDAAQQVRDAANMVVAHCEEHAVAEAIEAVLPGG